MTAAATMTVGELSRRTGVPIKALRDYTDWGLIDTLGRSSGNYRLYTSDSLWCVRTITELRRLGLTLSEIRCAADVASRDRAAVGPRLAEMLRERTGAYRAAHRRAGGHPGASR